VCFTYADLFFISYNLVFIGGWKMKILIEDKKKLGVMFVLMGLMIFIFCIGVKLDNRIRATAFIQSNLGQLKKYNIDEYDISYKLPTKWEISKESFNGEQIVYYNNFSSKDEGINGFVQVWNYNGSFKDFLEINKKISQSENKVKNFIVTNLNINNQGAYLITYEAKSEDNSYNAFEYFIREQGNFIKFSFFIKDNKFNSTMPSLFKALVETVKKE